MFFVFLLLPVGDTTASTLFSTTFNHMPTTTKRQWGGNKIDALTLVKRGIPTEKRERRTFGDGSSACEFERASGGHPIRGGRGRRRTT